MWRSRTLASQILLGVLGILLITVSLGGFFYVRLSGQALDQQYQQRALGIANTVAQMPDIVEYLDTTPPTGSRRSPNGSASAPAQPMSSSPTAVGCATRTPTRR